MEAQERDIAIRVSHLNKRYKLYRHNRDRVADALGLPGAHYTEHMALQDVSMTVYRGETVGIIGTNGSGKSTILKIITGVLNPTSGDVEVRGRISALLELGAGFNMEYNGIENIYLNGTMIGFSEKEIAEKIDAILDFADIGEYVYQPVKTYSSGMFMRLAFAVAINIEPEILIVDEALSVGDVFFQAKCYHKFDEFKKQGKTVLFVSHDLSNISKYCDRVVLLNQGVKLGEGSPKEMIDIYKQVLVGQYDPEKHRATGAGPVQYDEIMQVAAARADEADAKIKGDSAVRARAAEKAAEERMQVNAGGAETSGTDGAAAESGRNADTLEYGSRKAEITDYYITDAAGRRSNTIMKGSACTVHMRVRIRTDIAAPIFAFTIRNVYGVEICGTNTMFEKAFLEPVKAGEVKDITFTQRIDLQGGEYLISLGVTGYEKENFTVYHRLYDVCNLTVVSDKNTVGYYDMNSRVTVTDAEQE